MVSVAAMIAVAADTDGRRESAPLMRHRFRHAIGSGTMANGLTVGPPEAETFRTGVLRSLGGRGPDGPERAISGAHTGLKAAIARVFEATCDVAFTGSGTHAHAPKGRHTVAAAAIRRALAQPDQKGAQEVWRHVADRLRPRWPKLAAPIDDSETDVPAGMAFPARPGTRLHSTNPLERLNKEVKRRADLVGLAGKTIPRIVF